jgi:hypothetical protein
MKLFKLVEVDLAKERKRIKKAKFNARQRKAITKLVDLFEAGEFQKCLDHINDEKAFPYNEKDEYSEKEHIGIEIGDVLRELGYATYFTQAELLKQTEEYLNKQKKKGRK